MKITKAWIKKWEPCDEAVKWIEEQGTKDVFELIDRLRKSEVRDKYDWLCWAIPRLIKTKRDRVRFAAYCVEFIALPIIEDGCYRKATKDTRDAIQYAVRSVVELIEATYVAEIGVTRAVVRVVAWAVSAVTKAGKYVDGRRDLIIDYGIKLLKEQSDDK